MKTYREIYSKTFQYYWGMAGTLEDVAEQAAKEYAKQWIDRATDELNDYHVGFPEAYKRVMKLKHEIDEQ